MLFGSVPWIKLRILDGRVLLFWNGKTSNMCMSSCYVLERKFQALGNAIQATITYQLSELSNTVPGIMEEELEREATI